MNKRGFTLIEAIVSFAIIAIAGTMFMFGFRNVTTIATEGSIIKTETDELYNEIMSRAAPEPIINEDESGNEEIIDTPFTKIGITFEDGKTAELSKIYISKKEKKVNNEFNISLSRLIPLKTVDFLPDTIPDEPVKEDQTIKTTFKIIENNGNLPSYNPTTKKWSNNVSDNKYKNCGTYEKCLTTKASKLSNGESITDNIASYIYDIPIEVEQKANNIQYAANRLGILKFDLLSNGNKIQWYLLRKTGNTEVTLYGFLLPSDSSRYAIYKGWIDRATLVGLGGFLSPGIDLPGDFWNNEVKVNVVNINNDEIQNDINSYKLKKNLWYKKDIFKESSGIWYIYD